MFQLLIRKKAAEKLKKEQEEKAAERRKVIDHRCGHPKDISALGSGEEMVIWYIYSFVVISLFCPSADLMNICKQYYQRVWDIEASKWDLEKSVELNEYKVTKKN